MINICSEYPVQYRGRNVGSARIKPVGIRFFVSADAADAKAIGEETVFRLAAVCGDRLIPLGVMMPGQKGLTYGKMFTGGALREMGLSDIERFTLIGDMHENNLQPHKAQKSTPADWKTADKPGEFLEEREFRRIFSACRGVLIRGEKEMTYLAVPVVHGEEFPAMPVFCLGEAKKINGRLYIVFKIHNGKLSF